jgi:hypothetical protein
VKKSGVKYKSGTATIFQEACPPNLMPPILARTEEEIRDEEEISVGEGT